MQRNRSSSLGRSRNSTALTGRHRSSSVGSRLSQSSVLRRGSTLEQDVRKDIRPLAERSYQVRCIKKLMEFLTGYGYPHAVTQTMLSCPFQKDVFRIFEFIYRHIDPKFKLSNKPEDEIVRIIKCLQYPFALKKTSLQNSIGGRHNWGRVLGMLIWLIELVQLNFHLSEKFATDGTFHALHDRIGKAYQNFMETQTDDDELALDRTFEKIAGIDEIRDNFHRQEENVIEAERELIELEELEENYRQQLEMRIGLEKDAVMIKKYIQEMNSHMQIKEGERDNLLAELDRQCKMVDDLKEEVEQLCRTCREQKERGQSSQQAVGRRQELAEKFDREEEQVKQLEKMCWGFEMELSSLQRTAEENFRTVGDNYNHLRTSLRPELSCYLADFEANARSCSVEDLKGIKAQMSGLNKKARKEIMSIDSKLIKQQDYLLDLCHQINSFEKEANEIEKTMSEEVHQHEEFKFKASAKCEKLRAEEEAVSEATNRLRKKTGDVNATGRRIASLRKELAELKDEAENKEKRKGRRIQKKEMECTELIARFEEERTGLHSKLNEALKRFYDEIDDPDEELTEAVRNLMNDFLIPF